MSYKGDTFLLCRECVELALTDWGGCPDLLPGWADVDDEMRISYLLAVNAPLGFFVVGAQAKPRARIPRSDTCACCSIPRSDAGASLETCIGFYGELA